MKITKEIASLYEMRVNGNDNLDEINRVFSESACNWENTNPKNPDDVISEDIVIPQRGVFEWMPLIVRDTAGLRQWKDEFGTVVGESRFFVVETLNGKTDQPNGLTFKLPTAVLREI